MAGTHYLCIDIGTTWTKLGHFLLRNGGLNMVSETRLPSVVDALEGIESVKVFTDFVERLCQKIYSLLSEYPIDSIGLTGIREGLAAVDILGKVHFVSGNCILENAIDNSHAISKTVHTGANAVTGSGYYLLSLQGYLAYILTGKQAITPSELEGLGVSGTTGETPDGAESLIVPVGHPIGMCKHFQDVAVYLAGTDEQTAHFGAGLGRTAQIVMSTGSFWSLSASIKDFVPYPGCLRVIPPIPPFCGSVSLIGYRWGIYLQQILEGKKPILSPNRPNWAKGRLLKEIEKGGTFNPDNVAKIISKDIVSGIRLLSSVTQLKKRAVISIYGGGVAHIHPIISKVMEQVGYSWQTIKRDATLLGCLQIGERAKRVSNILDSEWTIQ